MRRVQYILVICILQVLWCALPAQPSDSAMLDLRFYADVMVNGARPDTRLRAETAFYTDFKNYLDRNPAWDHNLDELDGLTIIVPSDSTFRLITWQIEGDNVYRYRGFVHFRPDATRPVIELQDTRPLNSESSAFTAGQWYGAIYYGIEPFRRDDGSLAYVVLGFNAYTQTLNQRVADVLIVDDTSVTLGDPVFWADSVRSDLKNRIILEYADASAGTMRFDREKQLLIYDNVIPINTPEGTTLVPDGSYHGYHYRQGKWEFIDKVFTLRLDTPPGGRAKEDVQRDLFGRPAPNRKDWSLT